METVKVIEGFVAKSGNKYWGYFGYHDGYTSDLGNFGSIETAKIIPIMPDEALDFMSRYHYERDPYSYQDLKNAKIIKIKKTIITKYEIDE